MKLPSFKRWLYKMEYKHSRIAINNLMLIIAGGMLIVLVGQIMNPQLANMLTLNRSAILSGQVWRLFSFIFVPPLSSGLFFTLLGIYFYYWVGSALENTWGSFKFNVYYLIGVIALIITSIITGYADSMYLNMSLFFAFAILYPETELLVFFILPIKIKWLALIDALFFGYSFIFGSMTTRFSILAVLLVLALFFWSDIVGKIKTFIMTAKNRKNYKQMQNNWKNNNRTGGNNGIPFN